MEINFWCIEHMWQLTQFQEHIKPRIENWHVSGIQHVKYLGIGTNRNLPLGGRTKIVLWYLGMVEYLGAGMNRNLPLGDRIKIVLFEM